MLIEVSYKNGSKDRRLCSPSTTVVEFVRQAEDEHGELRALVTRLFNLHHNDSH